MSQIQLFEDSDFWSDYEQRKGRQLVPIVFGCEIHKSADGMFRFRCIGCESMARYGATVETLAVVQAYNHAVEFHNYREYEDA